MRTTITIVILLFTALCYGQKSTLIQNINFRAQELKHNLNKTGDSLILESKRSIDKVAIFNSDFEKIFIINQKKTKIPLRDIPVGRFVTEVKLNNKLIIITLQRHEFLEVESKVSMSKNADVLYNKAVLVSEHKSKGKVTNTTEDITSKPVKDVRFYWIVNKIHKGHSSRKIMKIGDKQTVAKVIEQNKIDLKTKSGKYNELTIWEVYDTTKFMRYKRKNPDYANAKEADCFNTVPFFQSLVTKSSL